MQETTTTIDRQAYEAEIHSLPVSECSPSRSECSAEEIASLRASSLVQKWRELEAADNRNDSPISACSASTNAASTVDSGSPYEEKSEYESDGRNESPAVAAAGDAFTDSESGAATPQISDSPDGERSRVSDMVKRLNSGRRTSSSSTSCGDENERVKSAPAILDRRRAERSNGRIRFIRGRQAARDILKRIERDREGEIARLIQLHPVSHFSHRSRIQALLKFKLLQQKVSGQEHRCPSSTASELDELQQRTSISLLRERFSHTSERDSFSPPSSNGSCRRQHQVNFVDSKHPAVPEHPSNENVYNPEVPARDYGQFGERLTPPSTSSTGEGWQKGSQSPDSVLKERRQSIHDQRKNDLDCSKLAPLSLPSFNEDGQKDCQASDSVWKDRRPLTNDTSLQENVISSSHEGFEEDAISVIEEIDSTHQNVTIQCREVIEPTDDSSPQRPKGGRRGDMNQRQSCEGSSEFSQIHRSSINESDWHRTSSTVVSQLNSSTQQNVERHNDHIWTFHESHLERIGNDLSEAMSQNWHESVSGDEERDCMTADADSENRQCGGFAQKAMDTYNNALYQAWPDRISENKEILELLARRRVSTTLASDFRVKMDQLMASLLQAKANQNFMEDGIAVEEKNSSQIFDQSRSHSVNQIASPSNQRLFPSFFSEQQSSTLTYNGQQNFPWFHDHDAAATSVHPSLPLQSLYERGDQQQNYPWPHNYEARNASQNSSISIQIPERSQFLDNLKSQPLNPTHNSPEMALICDLRMEMMRLRQDVGELKRSIDSCIKMQTQLENYMKHESSVTTLAGAKSAETFHTPGLASMKKGSCCICYQMQIDSLLYRCGHMCTCYECAYRLMWNSGLCPICQTAIQDVVRAYSIT